MALPALLARTLKAAKALQTLVVAVYPIPRPSEWTIAQLAPKEKLRTALLRYAVGIRVPVGSQNESFDGSPPPPQNGPNKGFDGFGSGLLFQLLPATAVDEQEPFAPGENPVAYVMDCLPSRRAGLAREDDRHGPHLVLRQRARCTPPRHCASAEIPRPLHHRRLRPRHRRPDSSCAATPSPSCLSSPAATPMAATATLTATLRHSAS